MLSSFRTFPSSGFIEAKYSDIRSALSAANSVFQTHNNNGSPKKVSANPVEERNSDVESTPERRQSRRHTRRATFQFVPTGGLPSTRIVVKTNDNLENIVARVADPSDELSCISLFATRHSNPTGKRERVSDFAGCYISLNSSSEGGIVVDRDVTDKGILLLCPPFEYEDTYYALGQRFRADHSSTYTLDDGSLVQDFLILSGKTQFSLVVSSVVSLPIPLWALNNGFNPVVISPKVVVVDEKIHVFYIVRVRLSEPTVPKGGTPAASQSPPSG
ncbi:hypothetical protein AGDE_12239 [Angomonas deanei]|uniref:Uncharacterized protein n=1 Tax=Angomonas deanei TaxID=59799 RepID=A0A7G2C7L0_9TRYP|nr:hypothetical protein AGDE_12239 [Angomonas deanei]CAD2215569.1 hypothetical protein, conserved [Angomonas deanei]|eukprot:EPY24653.1 hypothetical protein AGDE_12239 [Angomonas deanei]